MASNARTAAAGLIFSNIHDSTVPELTRTRTMASVPFGGKYRLVDFALSNLVNSGIANVGIITHNNYRSLIEHLDDGRDWDLSRFSGGVKILPPFITAYENESAERVYSSRLEALEAVMNFISGCSEEFIVLSDCDVICNIDLADVIEKHASGGADMTIVTRRISPAAQRLTQQTMIVAADKDGRITDFSGYVPDGKEKKELEVSMNIMVTRQQYLMNIISDAAAHGYRIFERDVIGRRLCEDNYRVFRYDGYYALINSLESYYSCSMELLAPEARGQLFGIEERPVLTHARNLPPTVYSPGSGTANSLIADGCVIEGTVENSVLFSGVKVGRGSFVRDSILFADTYVGMNSEISCVVTDKNVLIKDGRRLAGHYSAPFFIGKGKSV